MTQLQVAAATAKENARHNKEVERLTHESNEASRQHYERSDSATQSHYERSDQATKEHYERSDQAGMISANAAALNAATNKSKYLMDYDIEYNWTGDYGYPKGMPLSAVERNANLELTTLIQPIFDRSSGDSYYVTDAKTGQLRPVTTREQIIGIDFHTSPARNIKQEGQELANTKTKSETAKNIGNTLNSILNGLFGKQGAIEGVQSIVSE